MKMPHLFHKWQRVHRFVLPNERGWFEDRSCTVCGKTELIDHLDFFSTISDAIALGIQKGLYTGFRDAGWKYKP